MCSSSCDYGFYGRPSPHSPRAAGSWGRVGNGFCRVQGTSGRISGGPGELCKVARTFRLQIPSNQRLQASLHTALDQVSVDLNVRTETKVLMRVCVCVCLSIHPRAPRRPETQEDQVQQKPTQGSYRGFWKRPIPWYHRQRRTSQTNPDSWAKNPGEV